MMIRNFSLVQSPIAWVFFSLGALVLAVAGSDLYHWYATGSLWSSSKYSHGFYVTYSKAPGLFVAALIKILLLTVGGTVCIVGAFIFPSQLRKEQQARLAWKEKYPPHPWPSRPKGPD